MSRCVRGMVLWTPLTRSPLSYHVSSVIHVTWRPLSEDTFNDTWGAAGDLKYSYVVHRYGTAPVGDQYQSGLEAKPEGIHLIKLLYVYMLIQMLNPTPMLQYFVCFFKTTLKNPTD